jgi:hypothetical protein
MTQIERFKTRAPNAPEGRLMAAGSEESPEGLAMQRVARRLGVSAAAMAAASAASMSAPAAAATAATTTAAMTAPVAAATTSAAMTPPAAIATSTIAATTIGSAVLVKGLVVGLGLGLSVVAGGALLREPSPGSDPTSNQASRGFVAESKPEQPLPPSNHTGAAVPAIAAAPSAPPMAVPAAAIAASVGKPIAEGPQVTSTAGALPTPVRSAEHNATQQAVATHHGARALTESSVAAATGALANTDGFAEPERTRQVQSAESPSRHDAGTTPARETATVSREPAASAPTASMPQAPVDPKLAREIARLDEVRRIWRQGDASRALLVLRNFQRQDGFRTLQREALWVTVDLLVTLGDRAQAASVARQLLQSGVSATERAKLEGIVNAPGR